MTSMAVTAHNSSFPNSVPPTAAVGVEIASKSKASLTTLPVEIHLTIFKHLNVASAICLGLASRIFYAVLKLARPNFHLDPDLHCFHREELAYLLSTWMQPLVYTPFWDSCGQGFGFVTAERAIELEWAYWEQEAEYCSDIP
ncbi:hypothetical protein L207DRAFT_536050 [Hyaloscypha variabilis F]|uniref:F-box domain-containing protein n=1 Tax=Hyaloscypha variabilis (strain UAMH 11265 / GT02V1 / F) TaxID=1149755 RepID=A0A2J6R2N8_HYAVF|nr:hypothetical protein L207DRAFT_536050 [Hyaloscypha variabilis F]